MYSACRPMLGPTFRQDEEQPGHDHVVVVTERFWRSVLRADRGIVWRRVFLKGEGTGAAPADAYEVIGVVTPELEFFQAQFHCETATVVFASCRQPGPVG
jgi:hypothetical protein